MLTIPRLVSLSLTVVRTTQNSDSDMIAPWFRLFSEDFAADDFIRWNAPNECSARKYGPALRALTRCSCVVFDNTFDKTLYQRPFSALSVTVEFCSAFRTENIDSLRG
ncbi:hypothetical protein VIBNISOn1_1560045 [Vibrio nigripulchritudo SOn1]|uniref:Uncharacterized protein n=1 Tax=Vibrio nigripulchritudo SOn1 TaxID=1238450 RepID=A0AAV2VMB6_9VIBR|nr:hypothetical protein VIBNISOn1_1560045 [Vibrio nigripulchritudo SOn1]